MLSHAMHAEPLCWYSLWLHSAALCDVIMLGQTYQVLCMQTWWQCCVHSSMPAVQPFLLLVVSASPE